MTASMTAFARKALDADWGALIWEIRSVNNRYLDAQFRLPESFKNLEGDLREIARKQLSRGKVECTLIFRPSADQQGELKVNAALLKQLKQAIADTRDNIPDLQPATTLELLRWPGVLEAEELDLETIKASVIDLYKAAIEELISLRNREGEELAKLISARLEKITDIVNEARSLIPTLLDAQQEKLRERIAKAQVEVDPARLDQEIVLLLNKSDVDEELDRLDTHVKEVSRILASKGPIGRRLDFLMQELNREANTLSSKAIDTAITNAAVELKVLIEQMREQIQNIE